MAGSIHRSHPACGTAFGWAFGCILAMAILQEFAAAAQSLQPIVPYLQERLGINESQAKGGLGALLVFARERLPKPDFDRLARRMPNAEYIMDQTHVRGVVTRPLDDLDEYEDAITNLGISEQSAASFAPAVLAYLESAGYYEERDILSRALD